FSYEEDFIMPINKNELTKEMIEKAMQCKSADELMELAKAEGYDITKDEAEAYFAELADVELDEKALRNVAGGTCTLEGTSCWTLSN
ncbi:MAG: Nif11-like leader peptide family RiPP precursor, partial [Succiniclasticum sp.]|nr:Nif11-like leader peptide family RiPP precursor [Succiniclasticum sp.]